MKGEMEEKRIQKASRPSNFDLRSSGAPRRDICERTFRFAVEIVALCRKVERADGAARSLGRQLIRSGTSIGANVEEAQGGQSRADFISKYAIARKEARETRYWLRLLSATGFEEDDGLSTLVQECNELIAILTAIIKKTQSNGRNE